MPILREMCLTPLSQLVDERLDWLCPNRIAAGSLTILDGDPGQGKSLLSLDLAARLSAGKPLPDDVGPVSNRPIDSAARKPCSVLLLSAEDDYERTIRPRLRAAGADCSRIHRFQVRTAGLTGLPTLPDDCDLLADAIRETAARLVIFDPLLAFLSAAAGNNHMLLRQVLAPLSHLASQTGAALLLVRHLTKGGQGRQALYRGTGGMSIIGAARTAFLAGPHPDDPDLALLACTKTNLSAPPPTLAYRIQPGPDGLPVIDWQGPVAHTANDIILPPAPEHSEAVAQAIAYLQDLLAHGPATPDTIVRLAHAKGLTLRTLERAKAELKIKSFQKWEDNRNVWYWSLREDQESKDILRDLFGFVPGSRSPVAGEGIPLEQ